MSSSRLALVGADQPVLNAIQAHLEELYGVEVSPTLISFG